MEDDGGGMEAPGGSVPGARRDAMDLDGLAVSYLVGGPTTGERPPVVLLHGGGLDSAAVSWREAIPALAADRRVYAPDLPGYGDSDPPDAQPSIEYYVDVVRRFLDAVDVASAALVGISMGGGVALGVALAAPERVERLALVDAYGLGGTVPGGRLSYWFTRLPLVTELTYAVLRRSRWAVARTLGAILGPGKVTPALVDEVVELVREPRAGETFRWFQRTEVLPGRLRTDYVDRLPDVVVPTLVLHGEHDPLVPVAWAVRAGTLLPDAEVRVLPGCGHWPPREDAERFNDLLGAFLAGD